MTSRGRKPVIAQRHPGQYFRRDEAYEKWVLEHIFLPLGTDRPRLGVERAVEARAEAQEHQFAKETRYHPGMPGLSGSAWQAWGTATNLTAYSWAATAYEGHNYRLGLAGGQWSLAAVDYARLLSSVDAVGGGVLTDPLSVERLLERSYARHHSLGFFLKDVLKPGQTDHGSGKTNQAAQGSIGTGAQSKLASKVGFPFLARPLQPPSPLNTVG